MFRDFTWTGKYEEAMSDEHPPLEKQDFKIPKRFENLWENHLKGCEHVIPYFIPCSKSANYNDHANRSEMLHLILPEKYPYSEFFWSVFSCIRTKYEEIWSMRIHSECGKIWTRKTRHFFTQFSRNKKRKERLGRFC